MDDITDHPLMNDVQYEYVVKMAVKLIRKLGCPMLFNEKQEDIKVKQWMGMLPCDYIAMNQVMLRNGNSMKAMHSSTSSYHPKERYRLTDRLTYRIRGQVIITSMEQCDLHISYKAMKLDDEGFPMIVNDETFIDALESYIKWQWFSRLFEENKINYKVMKEAERNYYLNVAQAKEHLDAPKSMDEWENIGNILNSVLIPIQANKNAFSGLSNQIVNNI